MRLRLMLAMGLVGLLGFAVALGVAMPSAPAQSDIEAAQSEVGAATERLETLLDRLESAQQRGNDLARTYWQTESELSRIDQQIAASEQQIALLDDERLELLDDVRAIAVNRYVSRPRAILFTDTESLADREAAEALAEMVIGTDQGAVDQLAVLSDQHERATAELAERRSDFKLVLADVTSTRVSLEGELDELETVRGALESQLADLEDALAQLEAAEARRVEQIQQAEAARAAQEQRERAEQAAARAAAVARPPTPVPLPPTPVPPSPTPGPTATPIPNPQPSEPFEIASEESDEATPTPVPNPQPSQPFTDAGDDTAAPAEPTATAVPNPQPSEPFATTVPDASPVPNPQPASPVPSAGGIVCPLRGAFTHTDDFNAPRAVGGVHRANDLIASSGTPVIAVATGSIEHRESRVGGMSAHLKGDNGDYYFYTHLSGYENVGAGRVSAGTVIGYVGMTGNAPIPHLHFEIHRNGYGNYTNPYGPVRAACGT